MGARPSGSRERNAQAQLSRDRDGNYFVKYPDTWRDWVFEGAFGLACCAFIVFVVWVMT
jgi:hypothetical protein